MKKRGKKKSMLAKHKYLVPFALVFAVIGVSALVLTRAATPTASFEAETATLAGAQSVTDSNASNNAAIQFVTQSTDDTAKKCSQLTDLYFCDDFDGANGSAPDSTKWKVLASGSSWGSQCWKNLPENISMDGTGNLKLTLINKSTTQCTSSYGNPSTITSGGMDTSGKKYFHYGKFEIRAKLSCAVSTWGSIWMSTGSGIAWPGSGEIDIWESTRGRTNHLKQTIHAGSNSANHYQQTTERFLSTTGLQTTAPSAANAVPLCNEYHVYGMDWRPGYIQFTFDGQNTSRITEASAATTAQNSGKPVYWPFDTYDQRMLIDLQYGEQGDVTSGNPDFSQLPSSMYVDYVRVYN